MNLGTPSYWSPERVFIDIVKNNGFLTEGHLPTIGNLTVDAGGHPYNTPKGTYMELMLEHSAMGQLGVHDCVFSPGWDIKSKFMGKLSGGPEKFKLDIPGDPNGVIVQLAITAKQDGARLDVASCVPAGTPAGQLFHPDFLSDMRPFRVIRFMDWMKTNGAPMQTWANRSTENDFSQIRNGMAVEYMVALANKLGSDPWFTLPFDTDPAYYRNFAIYVRDHLAPGRKAYVELSNEVWNSGFKQSQDAVQRGTKLYPGIDGRLAGDYYYADRVRDVMKTWSEVFAGQTNRIVRVLGGQAVWKERSEDMLAHKETWKSVDALAIAPYFGHTVQDIDQAGPTRVEKVIARLPAEADQAIEAAVAQKKIADKYNVDLIGYEGGSDSIAYNPEAGRDANAINHDPRMYDIYMRYLEAWRTKVGGLLVLYSGTDTNIYGHIQYTGQPLDQVPRMKAVVDFIARHPK
ncbi:hypothetical protein [Sphingomonas natans]|nr:hypothetical protein [Sphingomonas sp. BIUV-7]